MSARAQVLQTHELIATILAHLPTYAHAPAAQTCHTWRQILHTSPSIPQPPPLSPAYSSRLYLITPLYDVRPGRLDFHPALRTHSSTPGEITFQLDSDDDIARLERLPRATWISSPPIRAVETLYQGACDAEHLCNEDELKVGDLLDFVREREDERREPVVEGVVRVWRSVGLEDD